jgi:hypothetical protein
MGTSKKALQQQCIKLGIPFQSTKEEIKLKTTDRLALDLRKDLDAKGVNAGGNKKELQKRCKEAGIPVQIAMQEITEGWEGKPKGMLQILFERGFINPERMNEYTVDGKNDAFGNHVTGTCLRYLMEQLSDFQDEETLLQYHGRLLGCKVDRTPKCHPEMAGEGVEYGWACGKNVYRRLPLKDKKTKAKFRESVSKCLDPNEVLTIGRQRLFSKRAREYMVAYNTLDNQEVDAMDETKGNVHKNPLMSAYLIEKIVKQYKTHRSAADFDSGFVDKVVDAMKGLVRKRVD